MKKSKMRRRIRELEDEVEDLRDIRSRLLDKQERIKIIQRHDRELFRKKYGRLKDAIAFAVLNWSLEARDRECMEAREEMEKELDSLEEGR